MAPSSPVFHFLPYSAQHVEEALACGHTPHFDAATPTEYDAFFTLCDRLGVLAGIEALPDPRLKPHVPLSLLVMLTICRFLHGQKSFRRVGEVLMKDQALLQRLGVAPAICERGYYQNGERKPFDEERFSAVFRRLDPEPLQALLVQAVQSLRHEDPQWFREGWFLMDSNHFRLKGSGQEYKWCVLLAVTPRGFFPVAIEFSPVPGDGETTIGKRVVARALSTYGPGFLRLLLMDAAYLDGEWLRALKDEHQIDWLIKAKEGMVVVAEMQRFAAECGAWRPAPPPKLDVPKEQLPTRHVCQTQPLYGFVTYGCPVNGCVVRDRYPPSAKHPEGTETNEYLITSRMEWSGGAINAGWRRRWDVESAFGQLTLGWGLGEWQIGIDEVYRVLILIMALTYTILQAYRKPERHHVSLQRVADELAEQQREARMLVRVGEYCVIAGPALLNRWLAMGLLSIRGP
jgi:hypothetical protein